jgi:hypothetical protein
VERGRTNMELARVRDEARPSDMPASASTRAPIRSSVSQSCEDCRAATAFHAWRDTHLPASFNEAVNFSGTPTIPSGKRAVIELVTATISVPAGERARLRLFTSLGFAPSNLDLTLVSQGQVGGQEILIATHTLRVYSDGLIEFNVNRDNAVTEGNAFICISGYLVDV